MNKHIVHYYHRAGSREQRVVRKNFLIKEALVLNTINNTLVNVVAKDAVHSVGEENTSPLRVFNEPV